MPKFLKLPFIVAAFVGLLGLAFAALPASAAGTEDWDGNGVTNGQLNKELCGEESDSPIGDPYIHWVFTTGGDQSNTEAKITILDNGIIVVNAADMTPNGNHTQWDYYSPWFDLATIDAFVEYDGTVGQGANLVISHGCPPEEPPQAVLDVLKTADGTYDCEYDWTIVKTADPETLVLADGASATVTYTIELTKSAECTLVEGSTEVTGTITVTNDGPDPAENVDVSDVLSDGSIADVFDCEVGGNPFILGEDDLAVDAQLVCSYLAIADSTASGTNTATATADNAEDAQGTDDYEFVLDDEINDCVDVDDTHDGGDATDICESTSYTYDVEITADGCEQETVDNTADVIGDEGEILDSDDATVTVDKLCLDVSKTVVTSFDREHLWDITKSVDTENDYTHEDLPKIWLFTDSSGDETATWTVDVTYEGATDSNFKVSGDITIDNTGTADVTITDISDVLGGVAIDVDCGDDDFALPYDLAAGATLTCTYDEDVENQIEGDNVATVTSNAGTDSDTQPIVWGDPTNETNATVNVNDQSELFGDVDLGSVTAPNDRSFEYEKDFAYADYGQEGCGDYQYDNTATIVETEQSADASLKVNVQCLIFQGETAWAANGDTPGSLRYTARGNWATYVAYGGVLKCTTLFAGQTIDVGDVCFSAAVGGQVTITVTLTGDWEFEDVAANLMVKDYATAPSGNPSPGLFPYKEACDPDSNTCEIVVPQNNFYGVHVNVGQWVPDPDFGP